MSSLKIDTINFLEYNPELELLCATIQITNNLADDDEDIDMEVYMKEGDTIENWVKQFPEKWSYAYGYMWFKNGDFAHYSPNTFYWEYIENVKIPKELLKDSDINFSSQDFKSGFSMGYNSGYEQSKKDIVQKIKNLQKQI